MKSGAKMIFINDEKALFTTHIEADNTFALYCERNVHLRVNLANAVEYGRLIRKKAGNKAAMNCIE